MRLAASRPWFFRVCELLKQKYRVIRGFREKAMKRTLNPVVSLALAFLSVLSGLLFAGSSLAGPLKIATDTRVDSGGRVGVTLHLENSGSSPLFHIHPMFHFHHTMASLAKVHRLDPGEKIVIKNAEHPPVVRRGSYPIVAMIHYRTEKEGAPVQTEVHTDSFSFQEALPSQIEGTLVATGSDEESLIKVMLKNVTPSFKNLRLMLVLPPELRSNTFQGMMGFTLRSGEEKSFEIPVSKTDGLPGGQFPVHLLVEYGEMMEHYSGDISGHVNFGPLWSQGPLWPHLLVILFVGTGLFMAVRKRFFGAPLRFSA